jgi:Peptidase inhibitor I78 family
MPRHYFIATALLACAVAACTPTPDEQQQAVDQAEQRAEEVAAPAAPEVTAGACDDSQAQWAVGKTVTDADVEQARKDAGAESARTIGPNDMVTMDFNEKRLNLDTDAKGVVTAVRCG